LRLTSPQAPLRFTSHGLPDQDNPQSRQHSPAHQAPVAQAKGKPMSGFGSTPCAQHRNLQQLEMPMPVLGTMAQRHRLRYNGTSQLQLGYGAEQSSRLRSMPERHANSAPCCSSIDVVCAADRLPRGSTFWSTMIPPACLNLIETLPPLHHAAPYHPSVVNEIAPTSPKKA
jgi:hypothetical protein